MDRSGPRRNRSVYNYAALNKKGFQSLRPVRVKSHVKRKIGAPSPGSGNWRVELLKEAEGLHLGHNNNREPVTGDTIGKGDNGLFSPVGFCTPSDLDTIGDTVSESEVTNYISLQVDMDLEERKPALQQSIASLKQKVEEQEDDELCQLMEEERQLKAKLHQGEGSAPGTGGNVNKIHTEKLAIKDESSSAQTELQNLTGLKFDMTGFLGSDLNARPSELKGVYSLAEREAQAVEQGAREVNWSSRRGAMRKKGHRTLWTQTRVTPMTRWRW